MACENYTAPLLVHSCVYVLECHGGRYYVGVSQNLSHRFAQHFSRRGSQMTRTYRPVRVEKVIYGGDYQVEKKTTLEYVRKYGFNMADGTPKVRGAAWAGLRSKPPSDLLVSEAKDNDGSSRETTGVPFPGLEYGTATQNDSLSRSLVHVFQEYPLVSAPRALRKDMESSRRHECE